MEPSIAKTSAGVIIGRFQTDILHSGHKDLIESVTARHKRMLVLLGCTTAKATKQNPLDFLTRKLMLEAGYPGINVLPLYDQPTDDQWSKDVDRQIRSVFDMGSVTIYGSRDGCIPHYTGSLNTVELEAAHPEFSGTEIRGMIGEDVRGSTDFRRGVI